MKTLIRSTLFLLLIAVMTIGFRYYANGDWDEQDPVEGGWGGIYTTFTDIDSLAANPSYTDWTTTLSYCDGQSQNDAEKYLTAKVYYNAGANDTVRLIIQSRSGSDNLITNVDTLGRFAGATTPAASDVRVSLSNYGRQYRVKIEPATAGDGTANARGNDVEIAFYCAKMDVINPHKKFTVPWSGGGKPGKYSPDSQPREND